MWITPLESQMSMAYPSVLDSPQCPFQVLVLWQIVIWQRLFLLQGFRILCANFGQFLRFPWPVWISWYGADVYLSSTPALRSTGGRSCTCCCFRRWGIYDICHNCDNFLTANSAPDFAKCCGTSALQEYLWCPSSLGTIQSSIQKTRNLKQNWRKGILYLVCRVFWLVYAYIHMYIHTSIPYSTSIGWRSRCATPLSSANWVFKTALVCFKHLETQLKNGSSQESGISQPEEFLNYLLSLEWFHLALWSCKANQHRHDFAQMGRIIGQYPLVI